MNHAVIAIFAALVLITGAIVLTYEISTRRHPAPRHAGSTGKPGRHARTEFPDPADITDPDGSVWLRTIQRTPDGTAPPAGPRPGRAPLDVLERVRAGLIALPAPGRLGMLPDDPPPADTGEIPIAVGVWGKDAKALADELAAEHLGVTGSSDEDEAPAEAEPEASAA
jgi:hypothetical protein